MVAPARTSSSLRRVSRREPCPICKHPDWCERHESGAIHCMRVPGGVEGKSRGGGYWYNLPAHDEAPGRVPWSAEDFTFAAAASEPSAPVDLAARDTINRDILTLFPVSPAHRAYLAEQYGVPELSDEEAAHYGTLPAGRAQDRAIAALVEKHGTAALLEHPGFEEKDGRLHLRGAGLLVAWSDLAGHVVALQVRKDDGTKYYLTSKTDARPDGPSPGAPIGVVRGRAAGIKPLVIVTEGAKKARAIAHHRPEAVVVALPGFAQAHDRLPDVLTSLQMNEEAVELWVALDQDPPETAAFPQVQQANQTLAALAAGLGYAARIVKWRHEVAKGYDDLLARDGASMVEVYHPRMSAGQAGGRGWRPKGLESTDLSDSEKLGHLANVLLNKTLKPFDKTAQGVEYLIADTWPRDEQAQDAPPTEVRCPIITLASYVNASRNTVSKSCEYRRALGISSYEVRVDVPADPLEGLGEDRGEGTRRTKEAAFWRSAPRPVARLETFPEAEHRVADRKRRCPKCGGERLVTHTVRCTRCDTVSSAADAERAADEHERQRFAEEHGAPPEPQMATRETDEAPDTPDLCTDSVQSLMREVEVSSSLEGACTESVHSAPRRATDPVTPDRATPPLPRAQSRPEDLVALLVAQIERPWTFDELEHVWAAIRRRPDYTALEPEERVVVLQAYYDRRAALCRPPGQTTARDAWAVSA